MARRVAIQGYKGCFHEQAARLFYACHSERSEESLSIVECDTFEDLYKALEEGRADAAVMAIENTVSGGLLHNFELLRSHEQKVKGEVYIRIEQNLMALPGQSLRDIKEVRTHYMAINQTRPWFENNAPWIRLTDREDTAKTAAQLAGNTIVAFESLSRDKFVVATHADINDEAQSVHYVKIGTTLTGDDKKSKTVDVTDDKGNAHPASLIDTVAYENLVPGIEYTMTGQLMRDGKEFGSPVSVKFTPKEANGTVEIPFTVDVTDFGPATTLVAFETLTVEKDGAPVVVAEHKDLNDKDQTIIIAKPDKPVDKAWISLKTGLTFYGAWIALGMVLLTLSAAGYVAWKRYRI